MGILNVTPDSFSDGGRYFQKDQAIKRAIEMAEEGADIIDIGGESTRPGSEPVSLEEELQRTVPIIRELVKLIPTPLSIDTYKAEVARQALDAGASMINDISGLGFDEEMVSVASNYKVPVVIMHIKGRPKDMQSNPTYEALIPEMLDYFRQKITFALEAGVDEGRIIIDPGIGFGKTFNHNLEILRELRSFTVFQRPLLVGASRKAFIGAILGGLPVGQRLEGTLATSVVAVLNGANILRVHDVKENLRAVKIADAIIKGEVS